MSDAVARTLSEYIETVQKIVESSPSDSRSASVSGQTFYRGHAKSSWKLIPRLYREGMASTERLLINDALRLAPVEFEGLTPFQKLAKMQHLGLPTRLLDITTNPLAALFFACDEPDGDGEVLVFSNLPTFLEDGYLVPITMHFVFASSSSWESLDAAEFASEIGHLYPLKSSSKADSIRNARHALEVPWSAVIASHTNRRLALQSGAFLMCGMKVVRELESDNPGTWGKTYWTMAPADIENSFEEVDVSKPGQILHRIRVPEAAKAALVTEMDRIDVNRRRLFPEPEHTMRYIFDNYSSKRWKGYGL